jgi:hypothetical protein
MLVRRCPRNGKCVAVNHGLGAPAPASHCILAMREGDSPNMHEPGDRPEAQSNAAEGSRSRGLFRSPSLSRVESSTLVRARGVRRENRVKPFAVAASLLGGLSLSLPFPAAAEPPEKEIVVTATRTAQTADETPHRPGMYLNCCAFMPA